MVNKDLNEVNTFLDNLPSDPCKMLKPEALCSLCEKLNEDVYAVCQERERDDSGLLLDAGGFTDVEDTIEAPVATPAPSDEDQPAMVKKVSDTISFEFHKSTEPPAPEPAAAEPTAAPASEEPAPPAPPAEAAAPAPPPPPAPPADGAAPPPPPAPPADGATPPPPPPPPPPPEAAEEGAPAAPEGEEAEEKPFAPPDERIEVRDRSTGLAIEFVPKKKHFKAKPKDALWDDIMGGETLFRTIMDEYIPPPEPETVEVEIEEAIEEIGEFPMEGEMPEGEVPVEGEVPTDAVEGEEEVLDIEVMEVDIVEEEPLPELGPEFAEATGHFDAGNYDMALASYDALIAEDPNKIDALIGRGRTLRMLSRYEEALTVLDTAIEKAPGRSDAVREREMVLDQIAAADFVGLKDQADNFFKAEQYAEALVMYDKAIELQPNDAHVLNNKALTLRHLERWEEARETYEETLRVDPENLKAKKGLEKTTLAIAQLRDKAEVAPEEAAPEVAEVPEGEVPAEAPAETEAPEGEEPKKPTAKKKIITPERRAELEAEGIEVVAVDAIPEEPEEEKAPAVKLPGGTAIGALAPVTTEPEKPEEGKKGKLKKGKKGKKAKKGKKGEKPAAPAAAPGKKAKKAKKGKKGKKGKEEPAPLPTLAPIGLEPAKPKEGEPAAEVVPVAVETVEEAPAEKKPKLKKKRPAPKAKKPVPKPKAKKKAPKPKAEEPAEAPVLEVAEPVVLEKEEAEPAVEKPVWKKKRARPKPKAPKKVEKAAPVLEPAPAEETVLEPAAEPDKKPRPKKGKPKRGLRKAKPEPAAEPELIVLEPTPVDEKPAPKPRPKKKKKKRAPAPEPTPEPEPEPAPEPSIPEDDTVFEPIGSDDTIEGEVLLEPVKSEPDEKEKKKKKEEVLDWGDLEELVADVTEDEDDLL